MKKITLEVSHKDRKKLAALCEVLGLPSSFVVEFRGVDRAEIKIR